MKRCGKNWAFLLGALALSVAAAAPTFSQEGLVSPSAASALTAVWANDGGDKVTQDELRASDGLNVVNSLWTGNAITLFGAKNEVIDFNLVLEAAGAAAPGVSVAMSNLTGPGGALIRHANRPTDKLFDWTSTESELFYVRYLQILGLSDNTFGGLASWQEATYPRRAQCPAGVGCAWAARPVANKFYPDIAVPLETTPSFSIASHNNQSIWADIYIPKTAAAGAYTGALTISENGVATHRVPITLTVRNFTLPDAPSSKSMLFTAVGDLTPRYGSAAPGAMNNQVLVAHRHKISIIDDNFGLGFGTLQPAPQWQSYLSGAAFTAANGYSGPGAGVGQDVFSIGTYGSMTEGASETQALFTQQFNGWESWFEAHSPATERFVYLCDEINCEQAKPTLATQLNWWEAIAGVGKNLHSLATQRLVGAPTNLSDPVSSWPFSQGRLLNNRLINGSSAHDQRLADAVLAAEPTRRLYAYSGQRPGSGSAAIEDDGTAMRELPWGQYKKQIDRWFIWESTYYDDYQNGRGNINLFTTADTFGPDSIVDPSYGLIYGSNGNGVMFYPGTDQLYPANSYGLGGPIASLRLKYWRRGVQDVDYLTLANVIDPVAVAALVTKTVPKVLWEQQCVAPKDDCSYTYSPISWSDKPDDWEAARAQLAHIIDGQ